MKHGRLIVFEGPDGCGKTTLSQALAERLRERGEPVHWSSFPGRDAGTLGHLVYRLHHDAHGLGIGSLTPLSLQTLHVAAHLDAIASRLRPQLESGCTIVLDRFWWSTWVYGVADGLEESVLDALIEVERRTWGPLLPDAVFVVRRTQPFRLEYPEKREALNAAYERLHRREGSHHRVAILWNEGSVEETLAQAEAVLA